MRKVFSKWPTHFLFTFNVLSIAWVTSVYQPLEDVVHWLFMHYQVMDLKAGKVMVHARVSGSWLVVISYVILLLHYSYIQYTFSLHKYYKCRVIQFKCIYTATLVLQYDIHPLYWVLKAWHNNNNFISRTQSQNAWSSTAFSTLSVHNLHLQETEISCS